MGGRGYTMGTDEEKYRELYGKIIAMVPPRLLDELICIIVQIQWRKWGQCLKQVKNNQ